MPEEQGQLKIAAGRGGTIQEITSFLTDLEGAYIALYQMDELSFDLRLERRNIPLDLLFSLGYPLTTFAQQPARINPQEIPPHDRLVVSRVRIESPGFWEVIGSLNPLQQIREYLNDRHNRRQDREFREAAEKEKLALENELLRRQIYEKENAVLRERMAILKKIGYSKEEIDGLIWRNIGVPLSRLGKHQDTRLIGGGDPDGKDAA